MVNVLACSQRQFTISALYAVAAAFLWVVPENEDQALAKLSGQIVSVTEAGDLVTNITVADLRSTPRDDSVNIRCDGHVTSGIFPAEHNQPDMTLVALEGTSGFLELSLVGDDASRFLGIRPGADVSLDW